VKLATVLEYLSSGGSLLPHILFGLAMFAACATQAGTGVWLTYWAETQARTNSLLGVGVYAFIGVCSREFLSFALSLTPYSK